MSPPQHLSGDEDGEDGFERLPTIDPVCRRPPIHPSQPSPVSHAAVIRYISTATRCMTRVFRWQYHELRQRLTEDTANELRRLVIMRGLPGSGKTFLSKLIQGDSGVVRPFLFSSFFVSVSSSSASSSSCSSCSDFHPLAFFGSAGLLGRRVLPTGGEWQRQLQLRRVAHQGGAQALQAAVRGGAREHTQTHHHRQHQRSRTGARRTCAGGLVVHSWCSVGWRPQLQLTAPNGQLQLTTPTQDYSEHLARGKECGYHCLVVAVKCESMEMASMFAKRCLHAVCALFLFEPFLQETSESKSHVSLTPAFSVDTFTSFHIPVRVLAAASHLLRCSRRAPAGANRASAGDVPALGG